MRLYPTATQNLVEAALARTFAQAAAQRKVAGLTSLGLLTAVTYWLGLLLPYSLFAVGLEPGQSLGTLTENRPAAQAGLVVTIATLWGLYYGMWRLCRSEPQDGAQAQAAWPMWAAVLGTALMAAVWLTWLYPIGSADIFDSIAYGRIAAVWGGNPFYQTISQYDDPVARFAGWPFTTSAYGPLWVMLAALVSKAAGGSLLANVMAFKLTAVIFYAGSVGLVAALLRRHAPERALAGTCLFALNPLVLYETAGNGHNDSVLVFCLLLMAAALARGRHTLAALALTAGILVKYIPLLLVPVLLAYSLRALPDRRARARYLVITAGVCGLVALAAWAPFWRGGDVASVGRRTVLFTTSLPAVVDTYLRGALGQAHSRYLVSRAALVLTVLVAWAVSWHTWWRTDHAVGTAAGRLRAWLEPVRAGHMLLLFYLLVTCLWFQPWYALWPLALAALLPEGAVVGLAMLLAYAAGWKGIYLDFFISPPSLAAPRTGLEATLGPMVLALPWLYAAASAVRPVLEQNAAAAATGRRLAASAREWLRRR